MKAKIFLVLALFAMVTTRASATDLWVSETYQCFLEDYANRSYDWINISWEVDYGLYQNYSGSYVRTVSFQEYKSGTYTVTVKWTETDLSDPFDPFRHKSHTWYFTCKDNPLILGASTINLTVGQTHQLNCSFTYNNNYTQPISYTSSNTNVATVSSSGLITAKGAGTATITAKSSSSKDPKTCTVTVSGGNILVNSITLNKSSLSLQVGQEETLTATVKPDNATDKTVTWTSSNTSIATVSNTGKVTAKAVGSATITCKANDASGKYATCAVTVSSVQPTAIDVSPSSKAINVGETFYCTYTLTPSNATTTVTWTSDNSSIATVNSSGKVTGISAGTTYINATTANGKSDWCKVTVSNPGPTVESISLWWSTTVHINDTKQLIPTITPSDANPTLTWTSSDTSVATVDQNGVVSGKKLGTARITVTTDNGKSDYCDIKVVKIFTALTAEGKTMTFQVLNETEKTCQAGEDPTRKGISLYSVNTRAVDNGSSGIVTIPSVANGYTVTGIGGLAFLNLSSITSVGIPTTVKTIGIYAFQGCSSIESMVIPNSVTSIEDYALSMCSSLSEVTLSSAITILNDGLFWKDEVLTSVTIPSSVEKIDWSVFSESGIKEITIPGSVTYIGSYSFNNCYSLEKVTSMVTEPFEVNENVFQNVSEDGTTTFTTAKLYVPKGTKSAYQSTSAWNKFSSIEEIGTDPTPDYTDISQYANIIYIEPATASTESTFTVPVKMKNAQANITGFQFDLVLPAGVSVPKDEDGFYQVELSTDRTTARKHTVATSLQSDGSLRIVCYSNNNNTFSGTGGNVLNLTLQTSANVALGDLPLTLRDVVMTTPAMDNYSIGDVICKLTIKKHMKGDVNGDGLVNVVDVAGVVNLILGSGDTSQLDREAADINDDNNINVVDVAGVVNIILGTGSGARAKENAPAPDVASLSIDDFSIEPGEQKIVPVNLCNPGDSFTGCQFDLYLPAGLSIAEEDGLPLVDIGCRSNARKHIVSTSPQPDGSLRVVCYSNSNSTFSDEDGEILTITLQADSDMESVTGNMYLRHITLSRPDVTGVTADDYTVTVQVSTGMDLTTVDNRQDNIQVYNLHGQKMQQPRKGINIINGRKVVVK